MPPRTSNRPNKLVRPAALIRCLSPLTISIVSTTALRKLANVSCSLNPSSALVPKMLASNCAFTCAKFSAGSLPPIVTFKMPKSADPLMALTVPSISPANDRLLKNTLSITASPSLPVNDCEAASALAPPLAVRSEPKPSRSIPTAVLSVAFSCAAKAPEISSPCRTPKSIPSVFKNSPSVFGLVVLAFSVLAGSAVISTTCVTSGMEKINSPASVSSSLAPGNAPFSSVLTHSINPSISSARSSCAES